MARFVRMPRGDAAYIKDWVFEPQVQNDMLHHLKQSWDKLPLQGLEAIGAHYLSDAGLEELLMDLYACREIRYGLFRKC